MADPSSFVFVATRNRALVCVLFHCCCCCWCCWMLLDVVVQTAHWFGPIRVRCWRWAARKRSAKRCASRRRAAATRRRIRTPPIANCNSPFLGFRFLSQCRSHLGHAKEKATRISSVETTWNFLFKKKTVKFHWTKKKDSGLLNSKIKP